MRVTAQGAHGVEIGYIMAVRRSLVVRIISFALLFGLFSPVQSAPAVDTVTKTFTIKGANSAALTAAKIRAYWQDAQTGVLTFGDIATTNSSGVATLTYPLNASGANYVVFPPSGDTTNAIRPDTSISAAANENINVTLQSSNFILDIQKSDGTAAGAGSVICIPRSTDVNDSLCTVLARGGAFGVKLPQNLDTTVTYVIGLYQYTEYWTSGQYSRSYGLKATGSAGSQTYVVYTDKTATTVLSPTGSTNVLKYYGGNISGVLKNADGTQLTVPSGVNVHVQIVNDATSANAGNDFFNSTSSPNANWSGRVDGAAGKYRVLFEITGSLTIPSFVSYLWKNSAGGFSTTENGTYSTTSPASLEFRLPAGSPNFAYRSVLSGTATPAAVVPNLEMKVAGTTNYIGMGGGFLPVQNGLGSFKLPDGEYRFTLDPIDQSLTTSVFTVVVTSGVPTVRNAANQALTPTSGVFSFSPGQPNIKIRAVVATNTSTAINNSWIEILKGANGENGYFAGRDSGSSSAGFDLVDGTYMVRVNPGDWMTYAAKSFTLVVASGVGTIQGYTASSGVFSLPLSAKNFLYRLNNPTNNSAITSGWINYCVWDVATSQQGDCGGEGVDGTGNGGAALENGTQLIVVYPGSGSVLSSKKYLATVANGVVTGVVTYPGAPTSLTKDVNERWVLSASSANVTGNLKASNGSSLTFASGQGVSLDVQRFENGNWQWMNMGSWRTSANFGFNLTEAGKYRIIARPQGFTDLAWSYSEPFYIASNGNMSKVSAEGASGGTTSLDNVDVTLLTANLKMQITDPSDSSLLKFGWVSIIKKESNGDQFWIANADIDSNNPGMASAYLADGSYRLELNPQQGKTLIAGLSRKYYDATVSGGVVSVTYNGATVTAVSGRFPLTPARANVSGRITDQAGSGLGQGNNKWVNINLQKYISAENRWDYANNWAQTDGDGYFSMSVVQAGKFRLRIEPNGFGNSGVTYSSEFTITNDNVSTFSIGFGNIKATAPSLKVSVVAADAGAAIPYANIEVRKNNNWIDWANTQQNGVASITFAEAGKYQLIVQPNQEQTNAGKSRKTYEVVATADSSGNITAVVTGLTATNGVYSMVLGSGSISGTIFANDGTTAVRDATIVPIDLSNNQEKWEYSVWSSPTGKWAMTLPKGTYSIIAKAPYGQNSNGNSEPLATVTVDAAGVATLSNAAASGRTANTFNISLKAPTWTGTVKVPTGAETGVSNAQVCLYNNNYWNCTNADSSGNWALSAQTGVTTYSANSFLVIGDYRNGVYPEVRFEGPTAVANALGAATGASGRTLRFLGANVAIKVTTDGTTPVPYVWVSLDRPADGGLGGNQTNALGIANLYVANLAAGFNVRIDINNNQTVAASYAPTIKSYTDFEVTTNVAANASKFTQTITLDTPNLRGEVREPSVGSAQGATTANSWVEVFSDATNQWVTGSNSDQNGKFSINIPRPNSGSLEYTMKVNPSWNSTGTSSANQYTVTVPSTGDVSVKVKVTNTSVVKITEGNYFPLTLAKPSISGTVVDVDGTTGVANSWVVPIDAATNEWYWQQGTNSQSSGAFGILMKDGSYNVQARVPWNTPNVADSAQCSITVSGGSITTTAGGCVQSDRTIKLALRAPNVTMTLKRNGVAVAFANVGISIGNWYVNAQSNKDGQVSIFIDKAAVLKNQSLTGSANKLRVWVDPPYGTSDMVRWDCQSGDNKPICSGLVDFNAATEYNGGSVRALGDIEVPGPNTKLRVMNPLTSANAGANAWVALFSYDTARPQDGQRWIGGSNSDSSGYAAFNVDTSTAIATTRYKLEVNPPWNQKVSLAQMVYDNLQLTAINNQTFNLGSPNATLTVKLPGGSADNKWGWIGIEEVNASNNNYINWVGGYSLNDTGTASVILSASKRYKITAQPAGGRAGTMTTCYIETSNTTVITRVTNLCATSTNTITNNALVINLAAGNVTGIVKSPTNKLVANATIYANVVGATDEVFAVVTSTLEDGSFGLNLDATKSWAIKILPFNVTGVGEQLAVKNLASPAFTGGAFSYGDISMVLKP